MTTYMDLGPAPQGRKLVASGDYKATDPAVQDVIVGDGTVGVRVNLNVTAASGGGGVTVTVFGYDEASDTWYSILVSALKTGVAFSTLTVDPRLTASANVVAQFGIPKKIRVACVGSGTRTTLNYSVGVDLYR